MVDISALQGISAQELTSSPERLRALPPEVLEGVRQAFASSLETVFLLAVPLVVLAFVVSWFLPQVTLRERVPVGAATGARGAEAEAAPPCRSRCKKRRLSCSRRIIASTMEPPPVQYVRTADGLDIAFTVAGQGLPFVFMPWPFSHRGLWWETAFGRPLAEALAQRFKLVQYDSRGQGMSTEGCPKTT